MVHSIVAPTASWAAPLVVLPTAACGLLGWRAAAWVLFASLIALPAAMLRTRKAKRLLQLNARHSTALTLLRGLLVWQTAFYILAVDFPAVFPSHHAKAPAHGTSVMDLGVGCTLLVSALSRHVARAHRAGRGRAPGGALATPLWPGTFWRAASCSRSAATLFALGLARTAVLSHLDYHVDASEYGTHWNFFITLGAVAALVPHAPADARHAAAAGSLLLIAHQAALSGGLSHWVDTAPRVGLIAANKEGLCALPGHVALKLLGDALGALLLPRRLLAHWRAALRTLALLSAALFAAHLGAAALIEPSSRRTCNLAYALWACAQLLLIVCVCVGGAVLRPLAPPPLIEAASRRPLLIFLLANLLTGAANAAMHADTAPVTLALATLAAYMAVLGVAAHVLEVARAARAPRWLSSVATSDRLRRDLVDVAVGTVIAYCVFRQLGSVWLVGLALYCRS